jgi:two-component system nitrate/nitrite sensor histidine kinase NarX
MDILLEIPWYIQRQPLTAGAAWLAWGLLVLIVTGGVGLFLFYRNRQEREKQALTAETDHLREEMEKLWQLSDAMNWSLPIKEAMIKMIRAVKNIAGAHRAQIYLLDVTQENLFAIAEEEDLLIVPGFNQVPKSLGRLPILFDRIEPVIIEDLLKPHPDDVVLPEVINDGNLSLIVIPLYVEREILGIMGIYFDYYIDWSKEKVELFSSIGRMIGKNLKNAKNSDNLRELAVLQERTHISQDLHDNFSQLTSALSLRAEGARLSLEENNLENTRRDLERIIDTAHEVQQSLRNEMISLRSGIDEKSDLMPLVRDSVERFKQLSNITVVLDDAELPGPVIVPAQVGSQFLRILQEGLSNVRRHSQASQVVIRTRLCGQRLCLEIEDNGRGFDPATVSPEHLGLQVMQERARDVGGRISIQSIVEGGTRIQVELPIIPMQGAK